MAKGDSTGSAYPPEQKACSNDAPGSRPDTEPNDTVGFKQNYVEGAPSYDSLLAPEHICRNEEKHSLERT